MSYRLHTTSQKFTLLVALCSTPSFFASAPAPKSGLQHLKEFLRPDHYRQKRVKEINASFHRKVDDRCTRFDYDGVKFHEKEIKGLIEKGVHPDDFKWGGIPLLAVLITNRPKNVQLEKSPLIAFLLHHKANPNTTRGLGVPILYEVRSKEVAHLLLAHGAKKSIDARGSIIEYIVQEDIGFGAVRYEPELISIYAHFGARLGPETPWPTKRMGHYSRGREVTPLQNALYNDNPWLGLALVEAGASLSEKFDGLNCAQIVWHRICFPRSQELLVQYQELRQDLIHITNNRKPSDLQKNKAIACTFKELGLGQNATNALLKYRFKRADPSYLELEMAP